MRENERERERVWGKRGGGGGRLGLLGPGGGAQGVSASQSEHPESVFLFHINNVLLV